MPAAGNEPAEGDVAADHRARRTEMAAARRNAAAGESPP
jgi:hypothetical protein